MEIYRIAGSNQLYLMNGTWVVNGEYHCTPNHDGTMTIPHSNFRIEKVMNAPTNVGRNYNDILNEAEMLLKNGHGQSETDLGS